MADLINLDGILVSREKVAYGYAPIKIAFRHPITDESMRSLAALAIGIEKGEEETMQKLGIQPEEHFAGADKKEG